MDVILLISGPLASVYYGKFRDLSLTQVSLTAREFTF